MSESNRVMVDIETMGNGPLSAIVAIGAVRFTETGIVDEFTINVDLRSSIASGMECDPDTILWWLKQDDHARASICEKGVSLGCALEAFANWIGSHAEVWGNGADFDNVILATAYRLCGMKQPWHYTANRCYRTVKNLRPDVEMDRTGVAHNALDDARSQALHLIECLRDPAKESWWSN